MKMTRVRLDVVEWDKEYIRQCIELERQNSLRPVPKKNPKLKKVFKLIREIIDTELTETQRLYINEYYWHNKSTVEIAKEHGVTTATVSITINRGEKKLLKFLKYNVDVKKLY
jgi:RNA polymerase sigma factor (sigma-70 family)